MFSIIIVYVMVSFIIKSGGWSFISVIIRINTVYITVHLSSIDILLGPYVAQPLCSQGSVPVQVTRSDCHQ